MATKTNQEVVLTKKQVIDKIKNTKRFKIDTKRDNRKKNLETMIYYGLSTEDVEDIVLNLDERNYKGYIECKDSYFDCKYLYYFMTNVELVNSDGFEDFIKIYIKVGFHPNGELTYIVSFHENE